MAQNLQGFSYKVCYTTANYTIIHQQLVAILRGFMRFVYILFVKLKLLQEQSINLENLRNFLGIAIIFTKVPGPSFNKTSDF